VDLRRNEGGNMWVMLRGLRPLVGNDPLGFFVTRGDHRSVWRDAAPREPSAPADHLHHVDPPVAVLTSRITASSGEAVAIAFRGRPETRSFGEPTWGLTTGNSPRRMPDGAVLELTTAAEADRLGRVYDDRIAPDDAVPLDWTKLDTAGDPVIAAALAWLRARPACSPKHEP
jgi:C-terminal processing protease CtpA/Prc